MSDDGVTIAHDEQWRPWEPCRENYDLRLYIVDFANRRGWDLEFATKYVMAIRDEAVRAREMKKGK